MLSRACALTLRDGREDDARAVERLDEVEGGAVGAV